MSGGACVHTIRAPRLHARIERKTEGEGIKKKRKKETETLGNLQRGCSQWLLKNGQLKDYVLSLTNRVITSTIKLILMYDS